MGEPEPQDGRSTRPPKPADPVLSPTCPLVTGCIPTCASLAKGEFAFSRYFSELRRVARSRRPPVDLADLFNEHALLARGVARNLHGSAGADRSALDVLDALSTRYPAVTGPIPLMYVLAPEGRAIKRRLGRLLARQTHR